MPEPAVLISSTLSKPMPKWMSAAAIVLGVVFWATAYRSYAEAGLHDKVAYNLFVGLVCLWGAGIRRKLYLSDVGVVREVHSWGRVVRRVLPWEDVAHVSLAFRGKQMMAFFEVDKSGWKMPFAGEREDDVRDLLEEMIPDVEVETIERR
jgi:hypothetical protein